MHQSSLINLKLLCIIASLDFPFFADLSTPVARPTPEMMEALRYYSPEVHKAAFVLPVFAEKEIAGARRRIVQEES